MRAATVKMDRCSVVLSVIAIVGVVFGTVVSAATPPPVHPDDEDWEAPVSHKPSTGLLLGKYKVRYEETRLRDVMLRAGGYIQQQGDAGDNIYWLCYTIADGKPSQRLWIIASGEMGGPENDITEVMGQVTAEQPTVDCPSLPKELQPVRLSSGLWLGAPETSPVVRQRKKPGNNGQWRGYYYLGKAPGDCKPDGYDVGNSLAWSATDGVISTIAAGQVTSC
jgi:hypothetical protein